MATVRISQELTDETKRIIDGMCRKDVEEVPLPGSAITVAYNDKRIIDTLIPPELQPIFHTMPLMWMEKIDAIVIKFSYLKDPLDLDSATTASVQLVCGAGSSFHLPHGTYSRWDSSKQISVALDQHHVWPELAPFIASFQHSYAVHKRWEPVKEQVLEFLSKFSTLNQAVKVWPGVKLYIGQEYLARLEKKAERSAPSVPTELPAMNYDELTAAAVVSRMGV